MGLYSNNRTSLGNIEVPTLEGYNASTGFAAAMLEAAQDDLKFFDMIIARDFQEAEMNASGYTNEASLEVVTEGAIADAFGRIIEFFKKLIAKVKAIFASVMAKINGVIMTDNKKLVEKYKKQVLQKNLKDMKYKWAKETGHDLDTDGISTMCNDWFAEIGKLKSKDEIEKWVDKNDDIDEKLYGKAAGTSTCTAGEFAKEAHDYVFESVEDEDTGAESKKTEVMGFLMNAKKDTSTLEKSFKTSEDKIKTIIKNLDKRRTEVIKKIPSETISKHDYVRNSGITLPDGSAVGTKGTKEVDNTVVLAQINAMYNVATTYQTVLLATHREQVNHMKYKIAQNRAFFTKAAAYRESKNESVLFNAIDEAVEFDVDTAFADYE